MSATAIVIQSLLAAGAVTAIVGDLIKPVLLPQGSAPPGIIVNIITGRDIAAHLNGPGNLFYHRMQVECVAQTATQADAIGDAVVAALNGIIKASIAGCRSVDVLLGPIDFTRYADDLSTFSRVLHFDVYWRPA